MSLAMEALTINYLNHGVLTAVNNVWAWIAFLTAAISFWKIKSSIHSSPLLVSSPPSPHASTSTMADQPLTTDRTTIQSFPSSKSYAAFCTLENRRSDKFSLYYPQDDDDAQGINYRSTRRMDPQEDERMMGSSIRRRRNHDEQAMGWEAVLQMKTSEMEWYRYQDLTVLNGNVVRLWNEITAY